MKRAVLVLGAMGVMVAAGPAMADGKAVYEKACAGCHAAMDPKLGDKKAFEPLMKKGLAAVSAVVIKGAGAMPPKGGAASDADAKAATEYMFSKAK